MCMCVDNNVKMLVGTSINTDILENSGKSRQLAALRDHVGQSNLLLRMLHVSPATDPHTYAGRRLTKT